MCDTRSDGVGRTTVNSMVMRVLPLLVLLVGSTVPGSHGAPVTTPSPVTLASSYQIERVVLQRAIHQVATIKSDDIRRSIDGSGGEVNETEPIEQYETRSYQMAIFRVEVEDAREILAQEVGEEGSLPLASSLVHGLTRLVCHSTSQLFESYPAPNRHRHALRVASQTEAEEKRRKEREARMKAGKQSEADKRAAAGFASSPDSDGDDDEGNLPTETSLALQPGPPVFLVPLHGREMARALEEDREAEDEEEGLHPIYKLLASTRSAMAEQSGSASSPAALEFALLLSYQYGSGSQPRKILAPRDLKSCELKFLRPIAQVHRGRGAGERKGGKYVWNSASLTGEAKELFGSASFKHGRSTGTLQADPLELPESTQQSVFSMLTKHANDPAATDAWPVPAAVSSGDPLADQLAASSACQFDPDSPSVFLESDAAMYGTVASQTRGMMAGLCAPIVSAVTGTFDSIVGGFILNAAQEFLPSGVSDALVEQITRQLPHMIARVIIPTIGESVAGTLPTATEAKITPYASHGISYKTSHDIVEDLTKNLVINIHHLVDAEMPKSLAVLHGSIVPHLLGKSVVHSVSAALTHSLAHSPLHDSFCMQCYEHGKQCEHCHFSQNKVWYNLYYAAFYSTYYSNYYWEMFTHLISEDRIRAIEPAQLNTQDRLRYRRIYSDKGEQVTRTWRRGEPDKNPPNPDAAGGGGGGEGGDAGGEGGGEAGGGDAGGGGDEGGGGGEE